MTSPSESAVLFADVTGSTRLYETAGNTAASAAIRRCLDTLRATAEASAGRVVKTIGDAVLVLFSTATDAAIAAAKMHLAVEAIPSPDGSHFGVRIAFQWGPVVHDNGDVFGDTVNLAYRIGEHARAGQTLTSAETAARLAPIVRSSARRLHPVQVKGKAAPVELWELVWRQGPDVTDLASRTSSFASREPGALVLRHGNLSVTMRAGAPPIVIGRDLGCNIVIASPKASRQHCTVERRLDRFILLDHSTNGTFVTVEGEMEVVLHREPITLRRRGWIAFGERLAPPGPGRANAVEFYLTSEQ